VGEEDAFLSKFLEKEGVWEEIIEWGGRKRRDHKEKRKKFNLELSHKKKKTKKREKRKDYQ